MGNYLDCSCSNSISKEEAIIPSINERINSYCNLANSLVDNNKLLKLTKIQSFYRGHIIRKYVCNKLKKTVVNTSNTITFKQNLIISNYKYNKHSTLDKTSFTVKSKINNINSSDIEETKLLNINDNRNQSYYSLKSSESIDISILNTSDYQSDKFNWCSIDLSVKTLRELEENVKGYYNNFFNIKDVNKLSPLIANNLIKEESFNIINAKDFEWKNKNSIIYYMIVNNNFDLEFLKANKSINTYISQNEIKNKSINNTKNNLINNFLLDVKHKSSYISHLTINNKNFFNEIKSINNDHKLPSNDVSSIEINNKSISNTLIKKNFKKLNNEAISFDTNTNFNEASFCKGNNYFKNKVFLTPELTKFNSYFSEINKSNSNFNNKTCFLSNNNKKAVLFLNQYNHLNNNKELITYLEFILNEINKYKESLKMCRYYKKRSDIYYEGTVDIKTKYKYGLGFEYFGGYNKNRKINNNQQEILFETNNIQRNKMYKRHKYLGYYLDNKYHGIGIFIREDGYYYQGEFRNGKKTGFGIEVYNNKYSYKGFFYNNKFNGYGVYYSYSSNALYCGNFLNNLKEGIGYLEYCKDKNTHISNNNNNNINTYYCGQWQNNNRNGFGYCKYLDGHSYLGNWNDNKMHGYGEFKWVMGDSYKGEFFEDLKHGYGIYYYKNNSYLEGNWKYNLKEGEFKYTTKLSKEIIKYNNDIQII